MTTLSRAFLALVSPTKRSFATTGKASIIHFHRYFNLNTLFIFHMLQPGALLELRKAATFFPKTCLKTLRRWVIPKEPWQTWTGNVFGAYTASHMFFSNLQCRSKITLTSLKIWISGVANFLANKRLLPCFPPHSCLTNISKAITLIRTPWT